MSSATRSFSVFRRKANYVDMLIPKIDGIKGYKIRASTTFDGVFADLFTADIGSGYLDPTCAAFVQQINNQNAIRAVFNPATFSLTDSNHIWLTFVPINFAGAPGTETYPTLLLPVDEMNGSERVIITGSAPNGAAVANSLVVGLPFRAHDLHVKNNAAAGGTVLYVATAPGGPERPIAGQEVWSTREGPQGCLLIRGGGGTVSMTADFTLSPVV